MVVGGAYVGHEALTRARELGVSAVVVGGIDDLVLRQLLGRDLGVAITGSETLGMTRRADRGLRAHRDVGARLEPARGARRAAWPR